jgi:PAS domain S-box-containing protein
VPTDRWAAGGLLAWIDHLDDRGVFVTDESMVVRSWNQWLSAHTGRPAHEVVGRSLYDLYPELQTRGFDTYYAAVLAGEPRVLSERFHRHLLPMRRMVAGADGFEMAQSVRVEPLVVEGRIAGTITVITDVTDRVITERELRSRIAAAEHAREIAEHASHLKDEFLGTLSHEIRTPLNAVIGWARVLRRRAKDAGQQAALSTIERNSLKQLRLVDDLLGMSRAVSGRLRLSLAATDLAALTEDTVAGIRSAAEAKGLRLHVAIDDGLPLINADAGRRRCRFLR